MISFFFTMYFFYDTLHFIQHAYTLCVFLDVALVLLRSNDQAYTLIWNIFPLIE